MSEREAAQQAYQDLQKSKNPSTFDVMGAFNQYYNDPKKVTSLAIPVDFGKSIPATQRAALLQSFNPITRSAPIAAVPQQMQPKSTNGFLNKMLIGMEKAYNLSAQAVSFVATLPEPTNPLYQEGDFLKNLRQSWDTARQISPGQAIDTLAAQTLGAPVQALARLNPRVDKFLKDHAFFASGDFDIFSAADRQKAFREQTYGRFSSFATDVVARFTIDPTIIAGKAAKALKLAQYAVKPGEVSAVLAGEQVGKRAERIKATLQDFVERTDGMNESELIRIDAIRKSANPATMADVMATANKIEDTTLRHATKTNIVQMAMGDQRAAQALIDQVEPLAAKIANLQTEINEAKYLGAGLDKKTGQLTMDLLNSGENITKAETLVKEYEGQLRNIYKNLEVEGALDKAKLPTINLGSALRQEFANSQAFIDVRAGAASVPVRVMTGFFYKRPKGWIDFNDNQSVLTVDNMLNQMRNASEVQVSRYNKILAGLKSQLDNAGDNEVLVKSLKRQIDEVNDRIKSATFTVDRKNELLARYTNAVDVNERANAYMNIEEELFNTIGDQFGYSKEQIREAIRTFATARSRAHNLIRERVYTAARDPLTGGPAGGIVKPINGFDGTPLVFPAPLNETQLVKQLPTLDIPGLYATLTKATRPQRFEYFGEKYRLPISKVGPVFEKAYGFTAKPRVLFNEMVDALDSLIKFEVLARVGYPIRNVTEGNMRILFTAGPMAILARAAGLARTGKDIIQTRFADATNEEIFDWSNKVKLLTRKAELEASKFYSDDPDLVAIQLKEIDKMLAGKVRVVDRYGMGLNKIKVGDQVITIEDALGATPEQAKFINERFIGNAARVIDDHFSEAGKKFRNLYETNGDWTEVLGTDANWADAYLRVVNRQIRNSKITKILLQDKPREVVMAEAKAFLTKTAEGQKIWRDLAMGRDYDGVIEANMMNIEQVFPSWISPELKKIALERNINADDIKRFYGTDVKLRPNINGAQIANANGTSAWSQLFSNMLANFYDKFGEIPERGLVRNPLFIDLYRKRIKASVENAIATYPGEDIPEWYLRKMERSARQWARSELRRTVYDTTERVESAQYLKYAFPFFGAFADVAEKWGRIVLDDPSVIRSLQTTYTSPDRLGMTEERDGVTYINIPGEWAKRMGLGDRPRAIPKPSLNLIFQGGSWWNPGFGWFTQFAASKLVKRTSDFERNALVKQILPYGATGTGWKDLLIQSPAARRAMGIFETDNPTRQNLTVLIMAEENAKFDQGLRDTKPTLGEINSRVNKQLALDVATRLLLPFASGTRSPYQFYIDAYHKLRQEDPLTAAEKFYEQYGDQYFLFTTSLSKNNTGIAASIEADKTAKRFSDLISKNPEYGWFVVGPDNTGDFSPTVYRKQFEEKVAPGSTVTFRTTQDAYKAIAETNVEKGWIKYNKGLDLIEAQRIARGLKSLNSKGAEDLKAAKAAFIQALSAENQDWASERGKIDTRKVMNFLNYANKTVQDPRLANRPDMKTMSEYLQGREMIRKVLAQRASKSIDNAANADVKEAWDAFTGLLIDKDVTFNRIFTRILENDNLVEGL